MTQVVVILVGLLLGYWLVSKIIERRRSDANASHRGNKAHRESSKNFENDDAPSNARTNGGDQPWHEVLGVAPNAQMHEIREAYRQKILQYHPDRTQGLGPEIGEIAERMTRLINAAYDDARHQKG